MTDRRRRYDSDRSVGVRTGETDSSSEVNIPDAGVESVKRDAIDRAERTLEVQRERFDRIDEKSSKLLRLVAALAGVVFALLGPGPVSAGSLFGRDTETLLLTTRIALFVGSLSLLATVFLAAATYITTRFRSSFGANTTELIVSTRFEWEAYEKLVLNTYADAIRENRPTIRRNQRLFAYTLRSFVVGVTAIGAATATSLLQPDGRLRGVVVGVTALLLILFMAYLGTIPSRES